MRIIGELRESFAAIERFEADPVYGRCYAYGWLKETVRRILAEEDARNARLREERMARNRRNVPVKAGA